MELLGGLNLKLTVSIAENLIHDLNSLVFGNHANVPDHLGTLIVDLLTVSSIMLVTLVGINPSALEFKSMRYHIMDNQIFKRRIRLIVEHHKDLIASGSTGGEYLLASVEFTSLVADS